MMLTLDVGSGSDKLDITKVNVSMDLRKSPQKRPNFVCSDANHIPFRDNVFDRVTMYEVVEHVQSPTRCLREISRVLGKTGSLELATPNVLRWRILLRQFRGRPQILSDAGHIARWSEAEMKNILFNTGFSNARFEYVTLPLVFTLHRILEGIVRGVLLASVSETNIVVRAVKP